MDYIIVALLVWIAVVQWMQRREQIQGWTWLYQVFGELGSDVEKKYSALNTHLFRIRDNQGEKPQFPGSSPQ